MLFRLLIALSLVVGLSLASPLFADESDLIAALQKRIVDAVERVEPSVVSIARVRRSDPKRAEAQGLNRPFMGPFFDPIQGDDPESPDFVPTDFGSGIVIGVDPPEQPNRHGYILTNYHVVRNSTIDGQLNVEAHLLYVRFSDRHGSYARIIAADPRSDLAVLVVDNPNLKPVAFGDGGHVRKGDFVVALGNPYATARDGSSSASWGIISNIGRRPQLPEVTGLERIYRKDETIHHLGNLIQVDCRLEIGSSGGPLINLNGEVIGINTSMAPLVGYEKSTGFAIPFDDSMLRVVRTLQQGREVEYGFLGVHLPRSGFSDDSQGNEDQTVGVTINVWENSPASLVLRDGDQILAVNDTKLYSRVDLTREIGKIPPGEQVELTVRRYGNEPQKVMVELAKWPVIDDDGIIATKRRYPPWRGLTIDFSTARHRYVEPQKPFPQAVLITEVVPGSPAAAAGLVAGNLVVQVNSTPVHSPAQFREVIAEIAGEVTLMLSDQQRIKVQGQ